MGLFGALFAGVAGLGSQSNKIGIVSNNISNVNTVGYKQGSAAFNTLVVPSASSGTFSPGGVLGNTRQLVSQQGLIQATTSVTDVAISGGGLFVVNTKPDGTGDTLYTRAGSFTPDSNGNFKNAAGFYLQGLQVTTPALSVNPGNLSTVNVNQNATGSSVSTTLVSIAANFNASQAALVGSGEIAKLSGDSTNSANTAKQILIPTTTNGLVRNDAFQVQTGTPDGNTVNSTFTYGGFSIGRDVTSSTTLGDGAYILDTQTIATGITTVATAASPSSTTSAINGIDVSGTGVDAVTDGPFTAGNLVIDGVTVPVAAGQSLATIAANIKTAIDTANGTATSTATVVGNPGNYSIVINDTGTGAGAGINSSSSALLSASSYTLAGPYGIGDENYITITLPTASTADDFTVGRSAYISGVTGTVGGNIAASDINGKNLTIASINTTANTVTLKLPTGVVSTTAAGGGGTAITLSNRTFDFAGNMLDASADSDNFLSTSSSSNFASDAGSFTVAVDGTSYNFSYNSAPNTSTGQFSSLATLVTAINSASSGNLTASIVNHQLYISATDANKSVTFANSNATGTTSGAYKPGIDWIQELGLKNIDASATGVSRFNSLQSLADQVNAVTPAGTIQATVINPTGISTASINAVDPRSTIRFLDDAGNTGSSIIKTLGFLSATNGNLIIPSGTGFDTGVFGTKYDASVATKNMSSGAITAQFTKDITVYDALGINHTISMNVLKLSTNTWAVEFSAVPADSVISSTGATATDGKIAAGTVSFNGDGTLQSLGGDFLNTTIPFKWTNGANQSDIALSLGTSGLTDGITQFAGASNVSSAIQNGSPTGQLTGVSVDSSGFVTASFSNGQTQKLYQIPLASVNNPNGLNSVSGNAYKQTLESGEVSLSIAGTNGTGTLSASALEQSNVDLSTQLTDLIVAQQAYGANTRVLTVTSQLLQQLNQIIQ